MRKLFCFDCKHGRFSLNLVSHGILLALTNILGQDGLWTGFTELFLQASDQMLTLLFFCGGTGALWHLLVFAEIMLGIVKKKDFWDTLRSP